MDIDQSESKFFNPNALSVKITILLSSALIEVSAAVLTPALPMMQEHFAQVGNADLLVKLVVALPSAFIVLGAPWVGFVIDTFGRKRMLMAAMAVYGLSGVSGYFVPSLAGILIGRALLGLATAGIITTITTLIGDYFSGQARAKLLGLRSAFLGFGVVVALLLGGILSDMDWRNPFLVHAIAFAVLPLILFVLHEPERPGQDGQGTAAEPQVTLPCKAKEDAREEQQHVLQNEGFKLFGISALLLAWIYGIELITEIFFFLIPVYIPFYLQASIGANAITNGVTIATFALTFVIGSLLFARVKQFLSYSNVLLIAFGLLGLSYEAIGLSNGYLPILSALAIAGLGAGILVPNLDAWLTAIVPSTYRGRALGILTASAFLGQFLSPLIAQPVVQQFEPIAGYGMVFVFSGWILVGFFIVSLLLSVTNPFDEVRLDA